MGSSPECLGQQINNALSDSDIDRAFTLLSDAYDAGTIEGGTCHSLTHQIGEKASELFQNKKRFRVTPKTAYCSYGFYHGFMEKLVIKNADMNLARSFCSYVDDQLKSVTPDATLQCFHGIGHGTVNSHDPRVWGKEKLLVDPALRLCRQVASNPDELSRCATGVFNGLANFYLGGQYNLVLDRQDPLGICRNQEAIFQDPCYISMNIALLDLAHGDLLSASIFIEDIPDDMMAQHAILNLAAPVGTKHINATDHRGTIAICRTLQPRLRHACIQGYAFGMLEQGKPDVEYEKPIEFCESTLLTSDEQQSCFSYLFSYFRQWYAQSKSESICRSIDSAWQQLCFKSIRQKS